MTEMINPPETAGQPNTVDMAQYIRQWAITKGYDENLLPNNSIDGLLDVIATGIPGDE